ncbi:uncharacterized protein LOC123534383 [Mercenaria mercenaria]|uniref:uncharacterized protein LOC123534383 n=1 Tax=Mercenaria mercenaria TaxID=6596 RepID=UPI00234F24E3|nr:uncharacterized protein LOC123534383 [Mercenaria mercenaria]
MYKIVRKRLGEQSSYRYYIKVNPALSKEEALLVRREWEPHIDKHGHLQPNGILDWFNTGLTKACSVLMAESEYVSSLRCETLHDGTVLVHATISSKKDSSGDEQFNKGDNHVDTFSINIYPVFTIDSLNMPSDLRFSSPLPISGPYVLVQKNLKQTILDDLENGKQIIFLESKNDNCYSSQGRCSLPLEESLCWRLNLNFTDHHIFQAMDKYCKTVDFRQVLILMNIIREQYPHELGILNNEILVNSIFILSQKRFSRLTALHDWFLELVKVLITGLRICFLPSFYLPRQNLLMNYSVTETERRMALGVLDDMLTSLRKNPKNIYDLTGYTEKKKNKQDADESEEDAESHCGNEETDDIEKDDARSSVAELHTC